MALITDWRKWCQNKLPYDLLPKTLINLTKEQQEQAMAITDALLTATTFTYLLREQTGGFIII